MKRQQNIPYGKIIAYVMVIVLMAVISGYVLATNHPAHLIATAAIIILCIIRLFHIYGSLVEQLMFVFNAVQNECLLIGLLYQIKTEKLRVLTILALPPLEERH